MKRKKSFDWYGARQRFSIRTYHFGAASVLLGLTLATGAQAVQAEELVADTTVTSSIQSPATTDTTPALTTETVTPAERTATINYLVNYVLEDGTLVNAGVKTATVTTTEAVASTSVEVAVEVPAGYELAEGQVETTSQEVTEGAENLVTVQLVKKAEVVAPTTEVATEAPATTTEAATETPADATEVAAPATVEEAKVVLEQVTSEAEVLVNEAERLVAASDSDNTALKAAAAATKLTVTEATAVLNDSAATFESVNAQIDTVRANVEALALELRKFLGTEDIQVSLAIQAGAAINTGTGVLVEAPSTDPSMDDPNGASVASKAQGTMTGTTIAGYYTFHYVALSTWYDAVRPGYYSVGFDPKNKPENLAELVKADPLKYGMTDSAYFRVSASADPATSPILVELVTKDGTVLETNYMNVGDSVNFTSFQPTSGVDKPIVVSFVGETKTESTAGTLSFQFDNNTVQPNFLVPRLVEHPTYYKDKDTGKDLATYTMVSQPGLINTPSGVRDIPGYQFVETTTVVETYPKYAETSYVDQTREPYLSPVGSKIIANPVGTDGTVVKELYIRDPDANLPLDYTSTSPDGFIKLLVTGEMAPGKTNTNSFLHPDLLTKYKVTVAGGDIEEGETGTGTPITDPANFDLSKNPVDIIVNPDAGYNEFYALRVVLAAADGSRINTMWIRTGGKGELYTIPREPEKINWRQIHTADPNNPDEMAKATPWLDANGITRYPILDEHGNLRPREVNYQGTWQPYSFNNNPITVSDVVLTHWYTPIPQEAIIRYQVEGKTDFLEESATLTGNPGTDITYSTEDTINKYKKLGYELVSDNFTTDAGQYYDYDETVKQEFLVVIKPRIEEVPKTVIPGQPVDPTDPNSPVWPATLENLERTQEVTRTVEYKYEDGTPVLVDAAGNVLPKGSTEGTPFVKTETVTFTRPAKVNLVTGEIIYGDWAADTTDTLKGNVLPEVPDHTASRTTLEGADAPMTETVKDKTVTATDADINEVVYYKENPKYGDVVVNYVNTDGKVIATPVVDTNDALVGTEYSTADRVPKKIIEDATGDVYYYKEIKAEDAAKETGKVVEGTTEVTYVYEKAGNVVVNYVTEDGTPIKTPVNDETNAKPGTEYNTTDNKPTEITGEDGSRYVLIPSKTIGSETGTVEGGKTTEITYVYKKVANWIPQIPGVPEGQEPKVPYPFDPTNPDKPIDPTSPYPDGEVPSIPHVPGFTPVDPKTNEPLKPVDPNDPGKGYVPPTPDESGKDTPIPYVQNGNVVVNYVTEDGTPIKTPVNDETNA
ncbi:mucin-binding protein, partial [Streptococcus suis]